MLKEAICRRDPYPLTVAHPRKFQRDRDSGERHRKNGIVQFALV